MYTWPVAGSTMFIHQCSRYRQHTVGSACTATNSHIQLQPYTATAIYSYSHIQLRPYTATDSHIQLQPSIYCYRQPYTATDTHTAAPHMIIQVSVSWILSSCCSVDATDAAPSPGQNTLSIRLHHDGLFIGFGLPVNSHSAANLMC